MTTAPAVSRFLYLFAMIGGVLLWSSAEAQTLYIESRDADGTVTDTSLYEEFGDWYEPGSAAKSEAPAYGLPGGALPGQGSRFSFNTTTDASYLMKIGAHEDFVPGEPYDVFITVPNAPTIDAANSQFVLFDDDHPEESPLLSGTVPLTYLDCGDTWYRLAEETVLGAGATLKISEASPQTDRFYADAIYVQRSGTDVPILAVGQRANLEDETLWQPWPSTLTAPSPASSVERIPGGLRFSVPESEKEMRWRHSLRPAWLETHPYLTVRYRASALPEDGTTALVRLCTAADSWFTAIRPTDLITDGAEHTEVIDLGPLSAAEQIVGIEISLVGIASLEITDFHFRDLPPGTGYPPPSDPGPVSTGFELDLTTTDQWVARPEWLSSGSASNNYLIETTGQNLVFSVEESMKGMKWQLPSLGSVDTDGFPYILMKYRCNNLRNSAVSYAVYLSGDGEARPFYHNELLDDGVWHWAFAEVGIPTVNQMAVQVQTSAAGQGFLEIGQLAFVDGDPRTDLSYFVSYTEGWPANTESFSFLDLESNFNVPAGQLLPRMGIPIGWIETGKVTCDDKVPFQLETQELNLSVTGIPDLGTLDIAVNLSVSELYLFLGAYFPARENPQSEAVISSIDETERVYIDIVYTDESSERFFPLDILVGEHRIRNNTFSALAVPAEHDKVVDHLILADESDGGLIALAAATVNTSQDPIYSEHFSIPAPVVIHEASTPSAKSPTVSYSPPTLLLENTWYRYTFDLSSGIALDEWSSHFTGKDLLETAGDARLFSGTIDGTDFTSEDFAPLDVTVYTEESVTTVTIPLELKGYEGIIEGELVLRIDDTPEAAFDLELNNLGPTAYPFELLFPDLPELELGADIDDLYYAFPQEGFLHSALPISVSQQYSGHFPMQFMDLYDASQGWGAYLYVQDLQLVTKFFELGKGDSHASLAVRYPTLDSTGFPANSQLETAPFVLGLHAGGWHAAMQAYCDWVASWYTIQSPRQQWFQDVYTCRRDYPIGGTWYLFDGPNNTYTFPKEIDNATRYLGGADLIDISSWAWSAASGRVGDYRVYELGGLENFHDGIEYSQNQGVPVGLYIEGYNADERSNVYQEYGEEWKMLRLDGSLYRNGTEIGMCPHVESRQQHLKQLYADVVEETGAASMYLDVFGQGTRRCHNPDHDHPLGEYVLRGEYATTRAIREGLNGVRPGIPLYTEYTPADVMTQYLDGSFNYTIWNADPSISPTETNLFRFCYPDFKQIQLVNGLFLARNWTEEGLKKAFMNGEGIWIKGDIPAWYDQNTIDFYIKSHEIYRDHRDAFSTSNPEPFIPTLVGNVYTHRFTQGEKQLFNFYNANWRSVEGELVEAGAVEDVHVVDLWGERMLDAIDTNPSYSISARLEPRDIGCVVVLPRLMEAAFQMGELDITVPSPPADSALELVAVDSQGRTVETLPGPASSHTVQLPDIFSSAPDKLIVKLKRDGIVLDEIILNDLGISGANWVFSSSSPAKPGSALPFSLAQNRASLLTSPRRE